MLETFLLMISFFVLIYSFIAKSFKYVFFAFIIYISSLVLSGNIVL